jgi:hypothetical protein
VCFLDGFGVHYAPEQRRGSTSTASFPPQAHATRPPRALPTNSSTMTGSRAAAAAFLLALLSAVAAAPASYSAAGGVYIVTVRPPAACVDSGWYQMHILATALGRYLCRTTFHPHRFRSIDFFLQNISQARRRRGRRCSTATRR